MKLLTAFALGTAFVGACSAPGSESPTPAVVHEAIALASPVPASPQRSDFSIDMGGPIDLSAAALAPNPDWPLLVGDPIRVDRISPHAALVEELVTLIPDAQLEGWRFESSFDANLFLSVEDPRELKLAAHADVRLSKGKPMVLLWCMQPDELHAAYERKLTIYRNEGDGFEAVMASRINVGPKAKDCEQIGWVTRSTTWSAGEGYRRPLTIHSWNGADSELVAETKLEGGFAELIGVSDWFNRPMDTWPDPVWVLFLSYSRR